MSMPDVGAIMAYEAGELDEDDTIALFQNLVDTGMAWKLQGSYGRTAQALIEADLITFDVNGERITITEARERGLA